MGSGVGIRGWDAILAMETERDTGFQFQHDFIMSNAKPEAGENEPFVRIAVFGFISGIQWHPAITNPATTKNPL